MNVLNVGQMLMWHIVLLPLVLGVLVAGHVLLVRRRGVVPPFERRPERTAAEPTAGVKAPVEESEPQEVSA
jgi:ubiquinol-cytochrome c reductase cytochrome b subunit